MDRSAGEEPRPKLRARVTEELAEHLSRGGDCVHQVGRILAVLDERVRVAEPGSCSSFERDAAVSATPAIAQSARGNCFYRVLDLDRLELVNIDP